MYLDVCARHLLACLSFQALCGHLACWWNMDQHIQGSLPQGFSGRMLFEICLQAPLCEQKRELAAISQRTAIPSRQQRWSVGRRRSPLGGWQSPFGSRDHLANGSQLADSGLLSEHWRTAVLSQQRWSVGGRQSPLGSGLTLFPAFLVSPFCPF